MNADEAAHHCMMRYQDFEIRRIPEGYQFVRFVPTGRKVPRQLKISGIATPATFVVPEYEPRFDEIAPTFVELIEKILTRDTQ